MPNRRAGINSIEQKDKDWAVDAPAYKRLRQQGYQPPDIEGSAALETRAVDPMEIEKGKILGPEKVQAYKTATSQLTEAGLLPSDA